MPHPPSLFSPHIPAWSPLSNPHHLSRPVLGQGSRAKPSQRTQPTTDHSLLRTAHCSVSLIIIKCTPNSDPARGLMERWPVSAPECPGQPFGVHATMAALCSRDRAGSAGGARVPVRPQSLLGGQRSPWASRGTSQTADVPRDVGKPKNGCVVTWRVRDGLAASPSWLRPPQSPVCAGEGRP